MDEQKYLILDLRGAMKDITREVVALEQKNGGVEILFHRSSKKFSVE